MNTPSNKKVQHGDPTSVSTYISLENPTDEPVVYRFVKAKKRKVWPNYVKVSDDDFRASVRFRDVVKGDDFKRILALYERDEQNAKNTPSADSN